MSDMGKLWGGRFQDETDIDAYEFNASISFDKRLIKEDIEGSIVHSGMLSKCGIISKEDGDSIREGLEGILKDHKHLSASVDRSDDDRRSCTTRPFLGRG